MTIGSGIFASTLLLVLVAAAWHVTSHHKWKVVGKIAAALAAVLTLIGGGLYGWQYYANLPPSPTVVTELENVKLGMSPTDVSLALGKPDTTSEPKVEDGRTRLDYFYSDPGILVTFYGSDRYSAHAEIICTDQPSEKLLGFTNYNKDGDITNSLGAPASTSVSRDGTTKIVSYPKWNANFYIARGHVTRKCISTQGGLLFTDELLSPSAQKLVDQKEAAQAQALAAAEARIAAENLAKLTADTSPKKKNATSVRAEIPSNDDPCGANLSRAERLQKLASYGAVRQISEGEYTAGSHTVWYAGGALITCQ